MQVLCQMCSLGSVHGVFAAYGKKSHIAFDIPDLGYLIRISGYIVFLGIHRNQIPNPSASLVVERFSLIVSRVHLYHKSRNLTLFAGSDRYDMIFGNSGNLPHHSSHGLRYYQISLRLYYLPDILGRKMVIVLMGDKNVVSIKPLFIYLPRIKI